MTMLVPLLLLALPLHLAALIRAPPLMRTRAVRMDGADTPPEEDPIYVDELWQDGAQVRYGAAVQGAGIGYCSTYKGSYEKPFTNSRAILLLDPEPRSEADLCALTDKLALSCECVALAPFLRGGAGRWPRERLGAEAWAAAQYLNGECHAESLAVVALGGAGSSSVLGLLAEGAFGAHAAVALCPAGDPRGAADVARAARELEVPLLAVCGTAAGAGGEGGGAYAAALRDALALNARLASDFYVAEFADAGGGFVMAPRDAEEAKAGERAIALVQGWVDRWCPEGLGAAS